MPKEQTTCRIIGIDPGTASVGYGVVDCVDNHKLCCVASGVISTARELPAGERLKTIRSDLLAIIAAYQPAVAAVEAIFFFRNAKTLVPVAQARGVIVEAATSAGLPVFEYTPMQVKLTLTGYGRAEKKLVQFTVARLLSAPKMIRPDDAADALAVAICHARMKPSLVQTDEQAN